MDERQELKRQIEELLIRIAKLDQAADQADQQEWLAANRPEIPGQTSREIEELHQLYDLNLGADEQRKRRVDRVFNRHPFVLRVAIRKAFERLPLTDDEFVVSHGGYLPEEWTEEMESSVRGDRLRSDWRRSLFEGAFNRIP